MQFPIWASSTLRANLEIGTTSYPANIWNLANPGDRILSLVRVGTVTDSDKEIFLEEDPVASTVPRIGRISDRDVVASQKLTGVQLVEYL